MVRRAVCVAVLGCLLATVFVVEARAAGVVKTGRTRKVDLIMRLKNPPKTIIFGSSRGMKLQPHLLKKITGRRTFNAAVSCGRPIDCWCFMQLIQQRFPSAQYRCLWLMDIEQLTQGNRTAITRVPDDLLWEPRLARFLPEHLQVRPANYRSPRDDDQKYTPMGWLKESHYEVRERKGMTLGKWMPSTLKYFARKYPRHGPGLGLSARHYIRECVRIFNSWGTRPVFVLSPYYSRLLRFCRQRGWDECRRDVLAFLRSLRTEDGLDLVILDLSRPRTFGGDPRGFFDGYHMRNGLAATVVKQVVRRSGSALRR